MRICFIADGISLHTQRWVNYFANRGHDVHLICSRLKGNYNKRIQVHMLPRLAPQIWAVSGYFSALLWLFQVRRLVKEIKPDILDAHYIMVNGYLGAASGFHPLVLTAWGSDILITPRRSSLHKYLTMQALGRADRLICWSSAIKEEIMKLGVVSNKLEVVFVGTNTEEFSPERRDEVLLKELDIADSPVVISIRKLHPLYDVETLVRAIPLVLAEIPQTKFIIAGEGKQQSYLKRLASSLDIGDSVRFVGQIAHDELPRYLASSDIYVSTSLSDGTSISLLEAMACGLAPVVTDIPANQPWIKNGENGFLLPPKESQELAEKVLYLIKNKEMRQKFRRLGRGIVKKRGKYEKQMESVENLYRSLLG